MKQISLSHHDNFKGIMFMLLHAFAASVLFSLVKLLSQDISSSQIVFFYKFLLLLIILPWIFKDGLKNLYTTRIKTYIIGGIFGTSATLFLMHGIKYIPLANVTALGYMEKILLIIIGVFYFKENLSYKKIIAIVLSFIGAVIVIFPQLKFKEFNTYYYFIFASVILWVAYCLVIKSLGKTESIKTQSFYAILISSLLSAPIAFINYSDGIISLAEQSIELKHLPLLLLIAMCYLTLSISNFRSFQCGDLAIISPFGYTKIIFSGLLGIILFNEYPMINSYVGYLVIAISSWYLAKTTAYGARR